ncbi:MAG: TonB family protein [Bacteroidia bacterium]|nr:TonB family protein [Bacteroidia bacterium]
MKILTLILVFFLSAVLSAQDVPKNQQVSSGTNSSNASTDSTTVRTETFNWKKALIILEGVEISSKLYSAINPDQIESIIKLKPDSAMEKYGKRGKNGVIILTSKASTTTIGDINADDKIYTFPEVKPEFPGGEKAMMKFISRNLRYPNEATSIGLQGTVITSFIVRKDGKIINARIVNGPSFSVNAEALRVINSMPNWTPGKNNGKAVNSLFTVPLRFIIQ